MAPRKMAPRRRPIFRRKRVMRKRSGAIAKYQLHNYKRYTWDYMFINQNPTGTSDLILNVDNVNQGKQYLGVHLGSLIAGPNNTSQIGGAIDFRMNMLPGLPDFTTLYDKYKVKGYKITFIPLQNVATPASASSLPTITYCLDQDDSAIPSDDTELRQRANCKIRRLDRPVSVWVKPYITTEVSTPTGTGSVVSAPKFIDLSNDDVQHRGLKFWIDGMDLNGSAALVHFYKVAIQVYFTCSQTR